MLFKPYETTMKLKTHIFICFLWCQSIVAYLKEILHAVTKSVIACFLFQISTTLKIKQS